MLWNARILALFPDLNTLAHNSKPFQMLHNNQQCRSVLRFFSIVFYYKIHRHKHKTQRILLLFGQQGNETMSRPGIIISKPLLGSQWQQYMEEERATLLDSKYLGTFFNSYLEQPRSPSVLQNYI